MEAIHEISTEEIAMEINGIVCNITFSCFLKSRTLIEYIKPISVQKKPVKRPIHMEVKKAFQKDFNLKSPAKDLNPEVKIQESGHTKNKRINKITGTKVKASERPSDFFSFIKVIPEGA